MIRLDGGRERKRGHNGNRKGGEVGGGEVGSPRPRIPPRLTPTSCILTPTPASFNFGTPASFIFGAIPTNPAENKSQGVFGHGESIPHGPGAGKCNWRPPGAEKCNWRPVQGQLVPLPASFFRRGDGSGAGAPGGNSAGWGRGAMMMIVGLATPPGHMAPLPLPLSNRPLDRPPLGAGRLLVLGKGFLNHPGA